MRRSVRVGDTTYMLYYSGVEFTLLPPLGEVLCTHRYGLYRRCTLNGVRIIDVLGEEIIAKSAFLVNLHTAMVCMFPPPHPLFPHLPRIFAPSACGSTPSPKRNGEENNRN